jgi:hypothetical protein
MPEIPGGPDPSQPLPPLEAEFSPEFAGMAADIIQTGMKELTIVAEREEPKFANADPSQLRRRVEVPDQGTLGWQWYSDTETEARGLEVILTTQSTDPVSGLSQSTGEVVTHMLQRGGEWTPDPRPENALSISDPPSQERESFIYYLEGAGDDARFVTRGVDPQRQYPDENLEDYADMVQIFVQAAVSAPDLQPTRSSTGVSEAFASSAQELTPDQLADLLARRRAARRDRRPPQAPSQ